MARARKIPTWALLPVLLMALGLATGCAASTPGQAMRGLNQAESDILNTLQKARGQQGVESPVNDQAVLEGSADQLAGQGRLEAALSEYSRAMGLAAEAAKPRLRAKSAALCLRLRMFPAAEAIYAELAQASPRDAGFQEGLGLALFGQGHPQQAREHLAKALELDPKRWRAHNALGILADRQHQPAQALGHFQAALALEPRQAALYNNQALAFMALQEWTQAEDSLRRALALEPGYRLAANNLGLVMARQGRQAEALRAFERVDGQAQAFNNLGMLLAWQGRYAQAAQQFRQALESNPRFYPLANRHMEEVEGQLQEAQPATWNSQPAPAPSLGQPGPGQVRLPRVSVGPGPATVSPASYAPPAPASQGWRGSRRGWERDEQPPPRLSAPPEPLSETMEPLSEAPGSAEADAPILAPQVKPRPLAPARERRHAPARARVAQAAPPASATPVAAIAPAPVAQARPAPEPRRQASAPLPAGFVGLVSEDGQGKVLEGLVVGDDGVIRHLEEGPRGPQAGQVQAAPAPARPLAETLPPAPARERQVSQRVVRGKIDMSGLE